MWHPLRSEGERSDTFSTVSVFDHLDERGKATMVNILRPSQDLSGRRGDFRDDQLIPAPFLEIGPAIFTQDRNIHAFGHVLLQCGSTAATSDPGMGGQ